ncbi:UNVERIFIED_CONTAM: hypothetical protein GTU68_003139 [Idotea baltica]|nr:hypothetical protein [Idotea baltica]
MKYTKDWLIDQAKQAQRIKYLFFWGHTPSTDGSIKATCFSQWWAEHPFEENGVVYQTAEHYMMAGKARLFDDKEILEQILGAKSAAEAKKLGRMVKGWNQKTWETERCKIVVQGNYLKFSQHTELKTFLLQTTSRVIVEASPLDRIWGIGIDKEHESAADPINWKGENLLGFCLMEVRDRLLGH